MTGEIGDRWPVTNHRVLPAKLFYFSGVQSFLSLFGNFSLRVGRVVGRYWHFCLRWQMGLDQSLQLQCEYFQNVPTSGHATFTGPYTLRFCGEHADGENHFPIDQLINFVL